MTTEMSYIHLPFTCCFFGTFHLLIDLCVFIDTQSRTLYLPRLVRN